MKRIAILCDGTWNSPTMKIPTNVVKLRDACLDDGKSQVVIYIPGVGVNEITNKLIGLVHKLGGGAFGWGLGANVRRAYQQLCQHYEPGDEIYIFGFSRGAYTARSLGGMIRKCGIVPKNRIKSVFTLNKAWRLYKRRGAELDKGPLWTQRKALSPDIATSEDDWKERGQIGSIVDVRYIGVWDTVGAKGLPVSLLGPIAKFWNRRYEFYDMKLSGMVKNARHAIALDEQRILFEPTKWDNLPERNDGAVGPDRPYQQLWFIGDHGTVGGSKETRELVSFPLEWIAQGAEKLGLQLDGSVEIPDVPGDASARSPHLDQRVGPLYAWRVGPTDPMLYHFSVAERMRLLGNGYKPQSASGVRQALLQLPAEQPDVRPEVLHA
ncbi:DUF2235 domain-containing protein [Cognatiyoonia sp. IB215446]|uniref:DUF2235 domain-containing protein n=1 Tax=Cognatiyoonia sp. IB215446 TaxID=3097355 RepID=UPI002A16EFAC|nr:DUF2235 domain-containing protein [Cognatiyoonia sp. IB215446]MDX8349602.1 DUF2235 domain-containing protein [Cognatiyoonia sp. IB215446]